MGNYTKSDLVADLELLGIKRNVPLLVHSSLRSIGWVEGGATTVIKALLEVLGEQGTLMVPALTGTKEDSPQNPPKFDVRYSKCWTGAIPETLRTTEGAVRSLHPTHSVSALGFDKHSITKGHELSQSPCDENSPYYKNCIKNGQILFIGVAQESNTTIHMCEELAKVKYHLHKEITTSNVTDYEGKNILVSNFLHDWEKPETDFNKLDEPLSKNKVLKLGKLGDSTVRLIDAALMLEFTVSLLKRNPSFLLV